MESITPKEYPRRVEVYYQDGTVEHEFQSESAREFRKKIEGYEEPPPLTTKQCKGKPINGYKMQICVNGIWETYLEYGITICIPNEKE